MVPTPQRRPPPRIHPLPPGRLYPVARRARRGAESSGDGTRPRRRPDPVVPGTPRGRICCRACGAPVTSEAVLTPVDGQAVHHRTNPAGEAFTFGCFSAAPGATERGPATPLDSWFAGHRWRLAHCRACGFQLGWRFDDDADGGFWGLILERLVSGADDEA